MVGSRGGTEAVRRRYGPVSLPVAQPPPVTPHPSSQLSRLLSLMPLPLLRPDSEPEVLLEELSPLSLLLSLLSLP